MKPDYNKIALDAANDTEIFQQLARDFNITGLSPLSHAQDAAPNFNSVTAPNSGLPNIFTTYTDPKIIKTLISPTKSEEVFGVAQKGNWLTDTAQFPVPEYSRIPPSYDDYSKNDNFDTSVDSMQRQSYHFQTWTQWGVREAARMGLASIDWIQQKNLASIIKLNKTSNLINLFGVEGLQLYGALNDPNLPPVLTPMAKTDKNGNTIAPDWLSTTDPIQIYNDILECYKQLLTQTGGVIDMETPMTLVIPTDRQQCLKYANAFNVKLQELLKQNFPNLEIKTLPELSPVISGGYQSVSSLMLFAKNIDGQEVVTTAFTEKLRAFATENYSSYQRQKKSQGGWGTIWYYPYACVMMGGI